MTDSTPCSTKPDTRLHGFEPPSDWVKRWTHLLKPQARVLDVACGAGRHTRWFDSHHHMVTAMDVSQTALDGIDLPATRCEKVVADLENAPWPLPDRQFDAVVVTNYLWRALMPSLINSVAPGGVLIYETFAEGNETVGKPSRPDFLLRPGELLAAFGNLRVVAYEDGFESRALPGLQQTQPRFVQRIVVVNPTLSSKPVRYALTAMPGETTLQDAKVDV